MITQEQIELVASEHSIDMHSADPSDKSNRVQTEIDFIAGANGALEQQTESIYNALKGLGLEKHSIALNVLRIAGIKLPKP